MDISKKTPLGEPLIVSETLPFGGDADPTLAMPCPIEDGLPVKVAEMLEAHDTKMEGTPEKRPEPVKPDPPLEPPEEKASQAFSWTNYTLHSDQKSQRNDPSC